MASSLDFVEHVCDQLRTVGEIRARKMFGEFMVYVNDKPLFLVCDNTVFAKIVPETTPFLSCAEKGFPYVGAKEHYVMDLDDKETLCLVAEALERVTSVPKKKTKKT